MLAIRVHLGIVLLQIVDIVNVVQQILISSVLFVNPLVVDYPVYTPSHPEIKLAFVLVPYVLLYCLC